MSKRKCSENDTDKDDEEEDLWESTSIPLPIQTFLWRQTRFVVCVVQACNVDVNISFSPKSPFIRPKISRLQEAAAMEQREACKLFEKVLVQNIQFGLSPSLTEAIQNISR